MELPTDPYETLRYETPLPGVARVVMTRAEARNAQNKRMLYELNRAFDRAAFDDGIKVIILAAEGPHFSSGHDLRDTTPLSEFPPVGTWGGYDLPGAEGYMAQEEEIYFGLCWRWRNIPKPMIAQVHGKTIAGGLMLVWVCDLVVASEEAVFSDPVVAMGANGVEYFAHPWELGPRKAKELLFTGDWLTAQEAKDLGMVNQVVPRSELEPFTLRMAEKIASKPSLGLKLAKQSVNQAVDAQGFWPALQAAMSLQQLAHTHNLFRFGIRVDPSGFPSTVKKPKEKS
jgi:enoyl-CoA hydratase